MPSNLINDQAFWKQLLPRGEGAFPCTVCSVVNPVREPDAGNPHVRFDEREVETEHGEASEAPATESAGNR
jgi:hypothetical protein